MDPFIFWQVTSGFLNGVFINSLFKIVVVFHCCFRRWFTTLDFFLNLVYFVFYQIKVVCYIAIEYEFFFISLMVYLPHIAILE